MPQRVHSSRCPPSMAVRHRAMASSTFDMLPGDPLTASFDECVSCGADQIGHLERWPVHLLVLWWPVFSSSESRGLAVALR